MRRICVFCGSSEGRDRRHLETARALGRTLAERGVELVFGGGCVGLMGACADAALASGGIVRGVIPRGLRDREVAHEGLTELFVVDGMHDRKALMAHLSDAFVALPGGLGTLEELFEALTWAQLRFHEKPCALLDPTGYFDGLLTWLDRACDQGFLTPRHRSLLRVARSVEDLLDPWLGRDPLSSPRGDLA